MLTFYINVHTGCYEHIDLAFLTGTAQLDRDSWDGMRRLMTEIVQRMDVRSQRIEDAPGQETRVGEAVNVAWEVYEDRTDIKFGFNVYLSVNELTRAFEFDENNRRRAYTDVWLNTRRSNTETGLNSVLNQLYQRSQGDRNGNSNELIIIVRGNTFSEEWRNNPGRQNRIRDAIRRLRDRNIATIVIADQNGDRNILRNLVTATSNQDNYIFTTNRFVDIVNNRQRFNQLIGRICPADVSGNYYYLHTHVLYWCAPN